MIALSGPAPGFPAGAEFDRQSCRFSKLPESPSLSPECKPWKGVSFELREGEVHALVGENGAGKSTLIKVMTGALIPDSGVLTVAGHVVTEHSPALARSLGIAAVYQQPALFAHLTVAENIAISLEGSKLWRKVDWAGRDAQARELLERAGSHIAPSRLVATLTMPEQQVVEIAEGDRRGCEDSDSGRTDGVAREPRGRELVSA